MRIMISSYNLSDSEKELAFKDMEEVHKIRGRILHLATIIECIFRENITEKDYHEFQDKCSIKRDYKKLNFFELIKLFIKKYETKSDNPSFNKIKNDLDELREKYRNAWSHGFVFYELFELDPKDKEYKPINYINNKYPIPIHFKDSYFDKANEIFSRIIYWLHCEKLIKLDRYKIELRITEKETKLIEESLR